MGWFCGGSAGLFGGVRLGLERVGTRGALWAVFWWFVVLSESGQHSWGSLRMLVRVVR